MGRCALWSVTDILPVVRLEQLALKDYLYSMQFKPDICFVCFFKFKQVRSY